MRLLCVCQLFLDVCLDYLQFPVNNSLFILGQFRLFLCQPCGFPDCCIVAYHGSEGRELCGAFLHGHLGMAFGNMMGKVDNVGVGIWIF